LRSKTEHLPHRLPQSPRAVACLSRRAKGLGAVALVAVIVSLRLAAGAAEPSEQEPVAALASASPPSSAKLDLGERLFHDASLSGNRRVACVTCHRLDRAGDDGRPRSVGADGRELEFNSPTVFNAARNFRLNWRGNFETLEAQTEAVLHDPRLMNTNWEELLAKLRADAAYLRAFAEVYGSSPDRAHVLDAIAAFQHSLLTPDSRFDRFLLGDGNAITSTEERGYQLFKSYGCAACHQGGNLGGNLFQKFGIFHDPFAERPTRQADLGRFTVTGRESDRHVFRVPSLRNVAVTAPYFHDGSTASLPDAVAIMARSQLGRSMPAQDIDAIVAFLATLTGKYRERGLTAEAGRRPQ
jgi:cytochrome c peroxidase